MPRRSTSLILCASLMLCGCASQRIDELSARDHARAGRPREALARLTVEGGNAPDLRLNEGMLLHAAGDFERSAPLWESAASEGLLHPVESSMLKRLRALNAAAITQRIDGLEALLGRAGLWPLATRTAEEASILVFVEQGWAPTIVGGTPEVGPTVVTGPEEAPPRLRLDTEPPLQPTCAVDDQAEWAAASLQRYQQRQQELGALTFDLGRRLRALQNAAEFWWTAPTRVCAAEIVTKAGAHVLLLPGPGGLVERLVTLAPGQRLILVTRA